MAQHIEKTEAILGATGGRFINAQVTGSIFALRILGLAQIHCRNSKEKE